MLPSKRKLVIEILNEEKERLRNIIESDRERLKDVYKHPEKPEYKIRFSHGSRLDERLKQVRKIDEAIEIINSIRN